LYSAYDFLQQLFEILKSSEHLPRKEKTYFLHINLLKSPEVLVDKTTRSGNDKLELLGLSREEILLLNLKGVAILVVVAGRDDRSGGGGGGRGQ
jgi:hypothetical protein